MGIRMDFGFLTRAPNLEGQGDLVNRLVNRLVMGTNRGIIWLIWVGS